MARHSHHTFFERLRAFDEFYEPVHREILDWLKLPRGARIADIGCGAGGMASLFAEAAGESGAVAAVETSSERLAEVRALLKGRLCAARISYHQGELPQLPFPNGEFDLTWCSRVIHHLADEVAGIRELARITKVGGRVVLREGGVPPHVLPHDVGIGAPGLEERLRVAQRVWFDKMHGEIEGRVHSPQGWLAKLRDAGLQNVTAKSFLYELVAPFDAAQTKYLKNWLSDCASDEQLPLDPSDRDALAQLCDEASEHYIFRRDDLHLLYVASIYVGAVAPN